MKLYHTILTVLGIVSLTGCSRDSMLNPEQQSLGVFPIRWMVGEVNDIYTKALVDSALLHSSCTPDSYGNSQSIGVWGEYTISENGEEYIYTEFTAEPLTYAPIADNTNPHNDWNYPGDARYWRMGGLYDFRACYPQTLMTSIMTEITPTVIQGPVNTAVIQQDILVAATQINTITTDLSKPVPLYMQHVLSALKFKVRCDDGYVPDINEGITSCWLQNSSNATDLFSPSGYLVHSGNLVPKVDWHTYESSVAPMYVWKHSGLSFKEEQTLYTENSSAEGSEYTQNGGWLLVIPQEVKEGTLNFCYTLKNSGDKVYSTSIPAITYKPSTQYEYVLMISGASVDLTLTIKEWNKLDSTHDIVM